MLKGGLGYFVILACAVRITKLGSLSECRRGTLLFVQDEDLRWRLALNDSGLS